MKAKINKVHIHLIQGDLLTLPVQSVVVVTDTNLTVDESLAAAAGPIVQQQTALISWCAVGQAVMTDSGNLKNIRKIIHAVAPRWGEGSERGKLGNVVWECLHLAEDNELESIALPAISVGSLGYPVENCAKIMLTRVIDFTFEKLKHVSSIIFCVKDASELAVFQSEFERQIHALKQTGEGHVRV